jgi:hypothetical protein
MFERIKKNKLTFTISAEIHQSIKTKPSQQLKSGTAWYIEHNSNVLNITQQDTVQTNQFASTATGWVC